MAQGEIFRRCRCARAYALATPPAQFYTIRGVMSAEGGTAQLRSLWRNVFSPPANLRRRLCKPSLFSIRALRRLLHLLPSVAYEMSWEAPPPVHRRRQGQSIANRAPVLGKCRRTRPTPAPGSTPAYGDEAQRRVFEGDVNDRSPIRYVLRTALDLRQWHRAPVSLRPGEPIRRRLSKPDASPTAVGIDRSHPHENCRATIAHCFHG